MIISRYKEVLYVKTDVSTGSLDSAREPGRSAMYISKYNRFVDKILDRVNKILKRSYDPVNVRLQNASDAKKTTTKSQKKKKPATNKQADMELKSE